MGVHNLMRLLQRHAPGAFGDATIDQFRGKTLAIDANICVYKAMAQRPLYDGRHIVRMLRLAAWMQRRQIDAVFVFDGYDPLQAKQKTLGSRRERKRRNLVRYTDTRRGIVVLEQLEKYEPLLLDLLTLLFASAEQESAECAAAEADTEQEVRDGRRRGRLDETRHQFDRLIDVVQRLLEDAVCCFLPRVIAHDYCERALLRGVQSRNGERSAAALRHQRLVLQQVGVLHVQKEIWFQTEQMPRESFDDYCRRVEALLSACSTFYTAAQSHLESDRVNESSLSAAAALTTDPLCIAVLLRQSPPQHLVASVDALWRRESERSVSRSRASRAGRVLLPMLFCVTAVQQAHNRSRDEVHDDCHDEYHDDDDDDGTAGESTKVHHQSVRCVAPSSIEYMQSVEMRLRIDVALQKSRLFRSASGDALSAEFSQHEAPTAALDWPLSRSTSPHPCIRDTLTASQALQQNQSIPIQLALQARPLRTSQASIEEQDVAKQHAFAGTNSGVMPLRVQLQRRDDSAPRLRTDDVRTVWHSRAETGDAAAVADAVHTMHDRTSCTVDASVCDDDSDDSSCSSSSSTLTECEYGDWCFSGVLSERRQARQQRRSALNYRGKARRRTLAGQIAQVETLLAERHDFLLRGARRHAKDLDVRDTIHSVAANRVERFGVMNVDHDTLLWACGDGGAGGAEVRWPYFTHHESAERKQSLECFDQQSVEASLYAAAAAASASTTQSRCSAGNSDDEDCKEDDQRHSGRPADTNASNRSVVWRLKERLIGVAAVLESQTVRVHYDQVDEVKQALRLNGVTVLDAPHEAEATCVRLAASGLVDALLSDDTDVVPFGGALVLRQARFDNNARGEQHFAQTLDCAALCGQLRLTREQIVDLCLMLGCDFSDGVQNLSPTRALELMRECGTLEQALQRIEHLPDAGALLRQPVAVHRARNLFLHNDAAPFDDVASLLAASRRTAAAMSDERQLRNYLRQRRCLSHAEPYIVSRRPTTDLDQLTSSGD